MRFRDFHRCVKRIFMNEIANKIKVKQLQIQVEQDPKKKQKLNRQLRVLQLRQEIEKIKVEIMQISK